VKTRKTKRYHKKKSRARGRTTNRNAQNPRGRLQFPKKGKIIISGYAVDSHEKEEGVSKFERFREEAFIRGGGEPIEGKSREVSYKRKSVIGGGGK